MKVLSFGRSALSTVERIKRVLDEVKAAYQMHPQMIVIVSALAGVTDVLVALSQDAASGKEIYRQGLLELKTNHMQIAAALVPEKKLTNVYEFLHQTFHELSDILHGVNLVKEISSRTFDFVMSFGEIWSSEIIAAALSNSVNNAKVIDAKKLIKTDRSFGQARIDQEESYNQILQQLEGFKGLPIIAGFIGSTKDDETSTLGKGGSELTATIIAAALRAEEVEIWTEHNGIMTADPKKVPHAFPIASMTYDEALELSHYGDTTIFPAAIASAKQREIPIRMRNRLLENSPGTLISKESIDSPFSIKGLSSIDEASLIRLEGAGLIGVYGMGKRVFSALGEHQINVMLISLGSSEHSVCFAVEPKQSDLTKSLLEKEFAEEIKASLIDEVAVENKVSLIGVVGENMRKSPGIAGRLFSILGKYGVNVVAIAQGSSELNISIAVDKEDEVKTLNLLHQEFFLARISPLNLFVSGPGELGKEFLQNVQKQADALREHHQIEVRLIGLANSQKMHFNPRGIDLDNWKENLDKSHEKMEMSTFIQRMSRLNMMNSVFIDCTACRHLANFYPQILKSHISIASANSSSAEWSFEEWSHLKQLATERGVSFTISSQLGSGLPILSTIALLTKSGDVVHKIELLATPYTNALLSGHGTKEPFAERAQKLHASLFPHVNIKEEFQGIIAAKKLLLAVRECNIAMELEDIVIHPLLPDSCFTAQDDDEFFEKAADFDEEMQVFARNKKSATRWAYIARYTAEDAEVALVEIDSSHPFYALDGALSAISITSDRYNEHPLVISGKSRGAQGAAGILFGEALKAY